jgi:predicted Zn-dependent protease
MSKIYRGLGKIPEAIDSLNKARALDPASVDIKISLGDLCSAAGNADEARKIYEECYLEVS